MKVVLNEQQEDQATYTGDSTKWPDGLYRYKICGYIFYILVRGRCSLRIDGIHDGFDTNVYTGAAYVRVEGYSGRISSVTPESE